MAKPKAVSARLSFPMTKCDRSDKVDPAIKHVVAEASCRATSIDCSTFGGRLTVYVKCPVWSLVDRARRAIKTELQLLRHHRLAGRKH